MRYDRRPSRFGDSIPVPFADQAADARAAMAVLRQHVGDVVVGLWGFSQGGWIAPLAAATWPDDVGFLVIVSPGGVSPHKQMRYALAQRFKNHGFVDNLAELSQDQDAVDAYVRGLADADSTRAAPAVAARQPWWPLLGYPDRLDEIPPRELLADLYTDPTPWYAAVRCRC